MQQQQQQQRLVLSKDHHRDATPTATPKESLAQHKQRP